MASAIVSLVVAVLGIVLIAIAKGVERAPAHPIVEDIGMFATLTGLGLSIASTFLAI